VAAAVDDLTGPRPVDPDPCVAESPSAESRVGGAGPFDPMISNPIPLQTNTPHKISNKSRKKRILCPESSGFVVRGLLMSRTQLAKFRRHWQFKQRNAARPAPHASCIVIPLIL
jgi:hypothetical protein